jgi:hypothetical protein
VTVGYSERLTETLRQFGADIWPDIILYVEMRLSAASLRELLDTADFEFAGDAIFFARHAGVFFGEDPQLAGQLKIYYSTMTGEYGRRLQTGCDCTRTRSRPQIRSLTYLRATVTTKFVQRSPRQSATSVRRRSPLTPERLFLTRTGMYASDSSEVLLRPPHLGELGSDQQARHAWLLATTRHSLVECMPQEQSGDLSHTAPMTRADRLVRCGTATSFPVLVTLPAGSDAGALIGCDRTVARHTALDLEGQPHV